MRVTQNDVLSLLGKYVEERTLVLAVFVTPSRSVARVTGAIRVSVDGSGPASGNRKRRQPVQTKSSFDFLIASSSMAIFETRSPLTSMKDSWSSHLARAIRCPYSSRRADSDSAHQLRDTQLETL